MSIFEKAKTVVTTRCYLKVVGSPSTFAVNGQITTAGMIVEVGMHEAAGLIGRGLAVDATSAEVSAAGANIIISPAHLDNWIDAA